MRAHPAGLIRIVSAGYTVWDPSGPAVGFRRSDDIEQRALGREGRQLPFLKDAARSLADLGPFGLALEMLGARRRVSNPGAGSTDDTIFKRWVVGFTRPPSQRLSP